MTALTTAVRGEPAPVPRATLGSHVRDYLGRVRGGDIGALPAVLGLVVLCTVFSVMRPVFLSTGNFANLLTQGAPVTVIAMGLIFVLLIGEIDLSAGFASGVCASVLAILLTTYQVPWFVSVPVAVGVGTVIGLVLGFLVAKVGIPSFVVTLAAFLGFQGAVLLLLKEGTIVRVSDNVIIAIANKNMPPLFGWLLALVTIGGFALVQLVRWALRTNRGLIADPLAVVLGRVGLVTVLVGASVYLLNLERSRNPQFASLKGVPYVVPIILVLLLACTFVLGRTAYGRYLYAIGGNVEAARRAGIPVDRIRISAFMICSSLAAIGGIIAASKAASVDPNTGGSNVLLYAVAAGVIGGTSLFGGKGRALDAVLGGAVIAVIINGTNLLQLSSSLKFISTGAVLLLAAGVDALSRRRAAATGHG